MAAKYLKRLIAFLWLGVFLMLPSCIIDDLGEYTDDNNKEVIFSVHIPGVRTRSLTETDEYAVETLDVLVFESSTGKFLSHSGHKGIPQNRYESGHYYVDFYVGITPDENIAGNGYDFMVLANARDIISHSMLLDSNGLISAANNHTKSEIQQLLTTSVAAGKGWIADTSDPDYRKMPMWGEMLNQSISAGVKYNLLLTRMTIKTDLTVDLDNKDDSFVLQEVWLYNYNTVGYLVPSPAAWSASEGKATDATVNNLTVDTTHPIDYSAAIDAQSNSVTSSIYCFEAAAGSIATYGDNPCIVVKATWTEGGNTSSPSIAHTGWYRLDFANTSYDDNTDRFVSSFLPLKRNHFYDMKVWSIGGPGYDSREEAYGALASNISVDVVEWNEGGLGYQWTNGQYTLGLSKTQIDLSWEERTVAAGDNVLRISTDYTNADPKYSGWKATIYADEAGTNATLTVNPETGKPWLRLSATSGSGSYATGGDEVILYVDENWGSAPFEAWIHVKAGNLLRKVKVTQGFRQPPWVRIKVDGKDADKLAYSGDYTVATHGYKQIVVDWAPQDLPVTITKTQDSGADAPFVWQNSSYAWTESAYRNLPMTIDPPMITANESAAKPMGYRKASVVTFTITDRDMSASDAILFEQINYVLLPEEFASLIGSKKNHTAVVKSNAPWKATWTFQNTNKSSATMDKGNMQYPMGASVTGAADEVGADFPYMFSSDAIGRVIFKFEPTDPDKTFAPVEVRVTSASAGTFAHSNIILTDDNRLLFNDYSDVAERSSIPPSVQGMQFKWGSLIGIEPRDGAWTNDCIKFYPTEYSQANGGQVLTSYDAIPFINNIATNNNGINYFTSSFDVTNGFKAAEGRGDICRYISAKGWVSGKWRIPTNAEVVALYNSTTNSTYQSGGANNKGWYIGTGAAESVSESNGQHDLQSYLLLGEGVYPNYTYANEQYNVVAFPTTGDRWANISNSAPAMQSVGTYGSYWSASPGGFSSYYRAYYMSFSRAGGVVHSNNESITHGFAVRCIAE